MEIENMKRKKGNKIKIKREDLEGRIDEQNWPIISPK